jgi:transcriptional regulator with XRE-family HTH domain
MTAHDLRRARTRAGLTQDALAKLAGWKDCRIICEYESGRRRITDHAAIRLNAALGGQYQPEVKQMARSIVSTCEALNLDPRLVAAVVLMEGNR